MIASTDYSKATLPQADWSRGVRSTDGQTPETLRLGALKALALAEEWADTAERLLAKAADLEAK